MHRIIGFFFGECSGDECSEDECIGDECSEDESILRFFFLCMRASILKTQPKFNQGMYIPSVLLFVVNMTKQGKIVQIRCKREGERKREKQ